MHAQVEHTTGGGFLPTKGPEYGPVLLVYAQSSDDAVDTLSTL